MLQFKAKHIPPEGDTLRRVSQENGISPLLASLLISRGLENKEEITAFLAPDLNQLHDPFLLPDMRSGVQRIQTAITEHQRICIYGDYDVDGICATTILYRYLSGLGADVMYRIPSRHREGYGMHKDAVLELHQKQVELIVTVDNGISAKEEVAFAASLGMDVVVTDHHQCPEQLPVCAAVIDPCRKDSAYPFPYLCGAGVALKVVEALGGREAIMPYLSFAALATVADVVPLKDENRAITAQGMQRVHQNPGLFALLEAAGAADKQLDSEGLAFRLAPRLNAAGRMGDAARGVALLLANSPEEARPLALELNEENTKRQKEEQKILQEAKEQLAQYDLIRNKAILLYGEDWNIGVIGIVASRLVEEYYRPVILFAKHGELLTGSGRSIPGIHLFTSINACQEFCERFGGHAQAAGLTIQESRFEAFFEAFQAYLQENIPPQAYYPAMEYDARIELSELSLSMVEELGRLAPFGEGNPQPVFYSNAVSLQGVECIGTNKKHVRATAVKNNKRVPVIAFGKGDQAGSWIGYENLFDLLYTAGVNEYYSMRKLQLQLGAVKETTFWEDEQSIQLQQRYFYDAFWQNILYNDTRSSEGFLAHAVINAVELQQLLQQKNTLVLCPTPQSAAYIRSWLLKRDLSECVDVFYGHRAPQPTGFTTVLLAPTVRNAATYIHTCDAVVACCPGPSGMQFLKCAPELGMALLQQLSLYMDGFLSPLPQQRERLTTCYKLLLNKLSGHGLPLQELVGGIAELPYESALLCALVFTQLGFFRFDEQRQLIFAMIKPAFRELYESSIYAAALQGVDAF